MNRKELRCGDFVQDTKQGVILQVGLVELRCADQFSPVPLSEEFFEKNGVARTELEGETIFFENKGPIIINARKNGKYWSVILRNLGERKFHYEGDIEAVHEFQHAMADCKIYGTLSV